MEPNGDIEGYNVSYREIEGDANKKVELGPDNFHKAIKSLSEFLVCTCTKCIVHSINAIHSKY